MGNAVSMAVAMWISILFFSSWLSTSTKRKIVGMGLFADIAVHAVLQGMFGGDAEGRAGLLLGGVLVNLTMHIYRRWAGWEKLSWDGWQQYTSTGQPIPKPEPIE